MEKLLNKKIAAVATKYEFFLIGWLFLMPQLNKQEAEHSHQISPPGLGYNPQRDVYKIISKKI
jgi:hypothetical protein